MHEMHILYFLTLECTRKAILIVKYQYNDEKTLVFMLRNISIFDIENRDIKSAYLVYFIITLPMPTGKENPSRIEICATYPSLRSGCQHKCFSTVRAGSRQ